MKITLAVIGKMKGTSPEALLMREYLKRMAWKITVKECAASDKTKEAEALLATCKDAEKIIALDERGKDVSSRELALQFSDWQQQGISNIAIIIGGADGLDETIRKKAHLTLAFGRATWPHMLVRAMLAEQLYRVSTILDNHPYHRD